MTRDDRERVRIELTEDEYERFRAVARERGLSLEETGRVAVREWLDGRVGSNGTDVWTT